jgi:hypothetical protein
MFKITIVLTNTKNPFATECENYNLTNSVLRIVKDSETQHAITIPRENIIMFDSYKIPENEASGDKTANEDAAYGIDNSPE